MFDALASFGKIISFAAHFQLEDLCWNDLLVRMENKP